MIDLALPAALYAPRGRHVDAGRGQPHVLRAVATQERHRHVRGRQSVPTTWQRVIWPGRSLWTPATAFNSQTFGSTSSENAALVAAAMARPGATTTNVSCAGCCGTGPVPCTTYEGVPCGSLLVTTTLQMTENCFRWLVPRGPTEDDYMAHRIKHFAVNVTDTVTLSPTGSGRNCAWLSEYPPPSLPAPDNGDYQAKEVSAGYTDPSCFEDGEEPDPPMDFTASWNWWAFITTACSPADEDVSYEHLKWSIYAKAGHTSCSSSHEWVGHGRPSGTFTHSVFYPGNSTGSPSWSRDVTVDFSVTVTHIP